MSIRGSSSGNGSERRAAAPGQPDLASRWEERFWLLLAGVFAFRLVYLIWFCSQLDLAGDEAYYWDWGRRLDWGYYSKPPMIGWLMGLAGWLTGNAEWGIRLAALVFGTGALVAMQRLARAVFDPRTAFLTVLLVVLTPANAALNLFFTIDAPLVLCWSLGLWLLWRAMAAPRSWGRWLVLLAVIGLGCLSKQMMLAFPAMMIVLAVVRAEGRGLLRCGGFWLAALGGPLFLVPTLWWQQRHGWITAQHMGHHFDAEQLGLGGRLARFAGFPLGQAALYSPITWAAVIAALWLAIRGWKTASREARFLAVFSAPGLLVVLLLALRQHVIPNWPSVFYIAAFPLAAAWLGGGNGEPSRWLKPGLVCGAVFALMACAAPVVIQLAGLAGSQADGFQRLRGWREAGEQAGALFAKMHPAAETPVLVLGHREFASQMAFHMPQRPRVCRWEPDGSIRSQYEVWGPPADAAGRDVFILYPDSDKPGSVKKPPAKALRDSFERIEKLGDIEADIGGGKKRSLQAFAGRGLRAWPGAGMAGQD